MSERLIDEDGIINVAEYQRRWREGRSQLPSLMFICTHCGRWHNDYDESTLCAAMCRGTPPTNEDR